MGGWLTQDGEFTEELIDVGRVDQVGKLYFAELGSNNGSKLDGVVLFQGAGGLEGNSVGASRGWEGDGSDGHGVNEMG